MKKLLGLIIFGMLFCNVGIAKVLDFKCSSYHKREVVSEPYKFTEDYDAKYIQHLRLDTSNKTMILFDDWNEDSNEVIKIDKVTDNQYRSGDSWLENSKSFYFFNRYTGVLVEHYKNHSGKTKWTYWYQCESTKQLY